MSDKQRIQLMEEIQSDERAFALLTRRLFAEGIARHVTYGGILEEFGDPREWPEYKRLPPAC